MFLAISFLGAYVDRWGESIMFGLFVGTLLFGLATGLACEIVVGRQIGAGRLHDADRLVKTALARGLVVSVAVAAARWRRR